MDKTIFESSQLLGEFTLPDGSNVFGELSLDGSNTLLKLRSEEFIPSLENQQVIHGKLHDLRRVSCIQCVCSPTGSTSKRGEGSYSHAKIFPHFVTVGSSHLDPEQASIKSVYFSVDDISSIFYDFDAFGFVSGKKELIQNILETKNTNRKIKIGDSPIIAYFTGQEEIISVDTNIGVVTISHLPSPSMEGSKGINIQNRMMVKLMAKSPMKLVDCIKNIQTLLRFLSILAGRKQSLQSIYLYLLSEGNKLQMPLELNWSFIPKRDDGKDSEMYKPETRDLPLDAFRRPDEFSKVLKHWIARDETWMRARFRYDDCLAKGNFYDADRLIAAANMFDILPTEAVPCTSDLSFELLDAKEKCLEIFRKQTRGIERDSVISALKRMSKPSLTKKVIYRANIVENRLGSKFSDLSLVMKTAVRCRNYYVHGVQDDFNFEAIDHLTSFLTEALEFVFVASDLIEAGWDVGRWSTGYQGYGHCFKRFKFDYEANLSDLKALLGK